MTTFTINEENEIVAFATAEEAATATATPFDSFTSQQEFGELAAAWPAERAGSDLEQPYGCNAGAEVQR